MMNLRMLLDSATLQNLGWTLAHSVWQLALVALALAVVLALLREASARTRYAVACLAMLTMLALPVATFLGIDSSSATPVSLQRADLSNVAHSVRADAAEISASELVKSHALGAEAFDETDAGEPLRRWAGERFASVLPWAALAWLACVALLLARLAGGWVLNRRLRRATGACVPLHGCQVALARLRGRLKVTRAVRLCRSALVEVPTVVGWLRPVILVPASALAGLTPAQLEAIIAHELAHVRRHDYLLNLLQTFVETLLFYHPAIWWVSRRIRTEREHACDDLAVEATGDVMVYARALTALEQLRLKPARTSQLSLAADGGSLVERIQRLIKFQSASPSSSTRAPLVLAFVAVVALASALVGAGAAAGQLKRTSVREQGAGARRRVAVTFVTLPMMHTSDQTRAEKDMRKLLSSLRANDVRAVGFVNAAQLYKGGEVNEWRVGLLRAWLDAGMELGSEGYAHPNLYDTPLEDYKRDVLRGEELPARLTRERGTRLRYFSYPYLNVGASRETKESFEKFLAARDMKIHKVTIDNLDWLFGKAYADARRDGDEERMRRISDEYVPYMERVLEFYENLARDTLGYEPPQVLMLTMSALNCEKFDDLAAMLRRRGYAFVTLDEAQADAAYQQPDTYTGAWGISWLQRWAMAKGGEFRDEPQLSPYMDQFDTYTKKWQSIKVEQRQ
jgi:beta-lactamase regulating signal transducer with metallopeptidase domain